MPKESILDLWEKIYRAKHKGTPEDLAKAEQALEQHKIEHAKNKARRLLKSK